MGEIQDNLNSLLTKLDNDAGVTDVDYNSTLSVDLDNTLGIPDDILFPKSDNTELTERDRILSDYFTQLRQTLIEIESKLP